MNEPELCPACGARNDCTLADPRRAGQACWCYSVDIDPAIIEALAPELRNQACLCLLYTSPSPRDKRQSRMPSSA